MRINMYECVFKKKVAIFAAVNVYKVYMYTHIHMCVFFYHAAGVELIYLVFMPIWHVNFSITKRKIADRKFTI